MELLPASLADFFGAASFFASSAWSRAKLTVLTLMFGLPMYSNSVSESESSLNKLVVSIVQAVCERRS